MLAQTNQMINDGQQVDALLSPFQPSNEISNFSTDSKRNNLFRPSSYSQQQIRADDGEQSYLSNSRQESNNNELIKQNKALKVVITELKAEFEQNFF